MELRPGDLEFGSVNMRIAMLADPTGGETVHDGTPDFVRHAPGTVAPVER
jgi:hypothetical protein